MKGFFRGNAFKMMLTLVVILGAFTILSITTGDSTVSGFFQGFISPMQETANDVLGKNSDNLGLSSMSRSELESYTTTLAEENATLRQNLADYYDVKQKNEQYAEAIGIVNSDSDISLIAASVISRDPTDVYMSFGLDVGSLDGVSLNDPVITSQGIVGVVSEIYSNSCRVETIYSENLQVGAVSEEYSENGVIASDSTSANSGTVYMKYLDRSTKITQGTIITTSGSGGIFPKGLVIGTVQYVNQSDTDVTLSAVLEPSADIKNITDCFVITSFNGMGDSSGVSASESANTDDGDVGGTN
jgi:rod shape-determining protein MreC